MSDDTYVGGQGENNNGGEDFLPVTRYPGVTNTLNTIFELLSNDRCRYLLYYLLETEREAVEFEEAVNAVYEYESAGTDGEDCPSREEIQVALHHSHVPRLADVGVVDHDYRHGTIRYTGDPALEEWVEHARYKELD